MNAAFNLVEPDPPSGAAPLSIRDTRARLAADGTITAIMEWVVRDFVLPEITPDRFVCPIRHRIDLNDFSMRVLTGCVDLEYPDVCPGL